MDKTLYANGVRVDTDALTRTELTKAAEILRSRAEFTSRGILSGGVVTAASSPDVGKVNIASFSGFTPNGEYVESVGAIPTTALADDTNTTVNYVCAVYTETTSHVKPHESNGSSYPTRAQKSFRIRVYTEADFNNPSVLPTSDTNLANDAKDRCLILAKVTAAGTGVAPSLITLPTTFNNIMYTSLIQLATISGVTVLDVDPSSETGVGTITFNNASAPTFNFYWTSPSGTISSAVPVILDSVVTITDGSSPGHWITLEIIVSLLPLGTPNTLTESITVYNLYEQVIPRRTAEDWLHRNLTGTGIVTPTNPHGTSQADLFGSGIGLLDEHQDVMHSNGIWSDSPTVSTMFTGVLSAGTGADSITFIAPGPGDLYYVNGKKLQNLTLATVAFDTATFATPRLGTSDYTGAKLYEFFVHEDESIVPHLRASYTYVTGSRNCTGTWIADVSSTHPARTGNLVMVVTSGTPDLLTLSWDGGTPVTVEHPVEATSRSQYTVRLFRPNGVDWIDVFIGDVGAASDQYLPTGYLTYTDSIVVAAPVSTDTKYDQYLKLAAAPYWYDTSVSPAQGRLGLPPYGLIGTRLPLDCRTYGFLAKKDLADSAKEELVYKPENDFFGSGILLNREGIKSFAPSGTSGTIYMAGGSYYFRGERKDILGGNVAIADDKTSLVYIDENGTLQVIDVTTTFGGNNDLAFEYVVGSTFWRNVKYDICPVADKTLDTNEFTKSEKGVPLWFITRASGNIDYAETFCVAKNLLAGNWTIGEFYPLLMTYSNGCAMFDNLRASCAWARLHKSRLDRYDQVIDMKLVRNSYVFSQVTLPANTRLTGSRDQAYLIINTVLASGAVKLSNGCVVEEVSFLPLATASAGSYALALASDTKISRCLSARALHETNFGFIYAATGTAYNNVLIEDNNVLCRRFLTGCSNVGNYFINVRGNYIEQSEAITAGGTYAMIELSGKASHSDIRISNNNIIIGTGASALNGIYMRATGGAYINENSFYVLGSSTAILCITLASCLDSFVNANNFIAETGSTSLYDAVYLLGTASNVTVSGNKIQKPLIGIYANLSTLEGVTITNNEVVGELAWFATTFGIKVDVTPTGSSILEGLVINNNRVSNITNTATGISAISVLITDPSHRLTSIKGIDLNNNYINGLRVLENDAKAIFGISVDIDSTNTILVGVSAKNNTITGFGTVTVGHVESSGTAICSGVWFKNRGSSTLTDNITISGNNIEFLVSSALKTGIGIYSDFGNTNISNNDVTTLQDTCVLVEQYYTKVMNNKLFSTYCAIGCSNASYSLIEGCDIQVNTAAAITGYGSCGIYFGGTNCAGFTIKNCKISLTGPGGALLADSCNIAINGASAQMSNFSIIGCETRQTLTSMSAREGYHIKLVEPQGAFIVKDNVIWNDNAASLCNGLTLIASTSDFNGMIDHNVIYGSNRLSSRGGVYTDSCFELNVDYTTMTAPTDYLHKTRLYSNAVYLSPAFIDPGYVTNPHRYLDPTGVMSRAIDSTAGIIGTNVSDEFSAATPSIYSQVTF